MLRATIVVLVIVHIVVTVGAEFLSARALKRFVHPTVAIVTPFSHLLLLSRWGYLAGELHSDPQSPIWNPPTSTENSGKPACYLNESQDYQMPLEHRIRIPPLAHFSPSCLTCDCIELSDAGDLLESYRPGWGKV
jgi:hypothetical protein